jgi:hypothetical protein
MAAHPPGQVAVVMTAEAAGEPLDRLMSSSFAIYEDGQLVEPATGKQTLLEPERVMGFHTLLLLDLTGDAAHPQNRTALARAAGNFVDQVRRTQSVSVYAFDGAATPVFLAEYPQAQGAAALGAIPEVEGFHSRDESRDLRSSVIDALKQLNARLMQDPKPLHAGTLVVFTQGPDLAGRFDEDDYYTTVEATRRDIVVVHVDEKPDNEVEQLANGGLIHLDQLVNAGPVFEGAAFRVNALKDRHYLLSYCSPSRAGKRLLRVDVTGFDEEGNEKRGTVDLEFDSTGFGPGCDSKQTPRFGTAGADASQVEASPPVPGEPAPGADGGEAPEGEIVPPPDRPGYGD